MVERLSSIDRLEPEIRAEIGRLRQNGRTLDQILGHLKTLGGIAPVSRSALGRHIQGLAKMGERMRRSRQVAEALVQEMGGAPESQTARVAIEFMQTAVLDLFMRDGEANEDGSVATAPADPKSIHDLSKALDHLARASKTNVEFAAAAEKRVAERERLAAAERVETVAKERGMSRDLVDAIKAGIFGVKVEAAAP